MGLFRKLNGVYRVHRFAVEGIKIFVAEMRMFGKRDDEM